MSTDCTTSTDGVQTLVVLGASGDLTSRLLLPGLASLLAVEPGRRVRLVGAARGHHSDEEWQAKVRGVLEKSHVDEECVAATVGLAHYVDIDATSRDDLATLIRQLPCDAVWYFALPPAVTIAACEELATLTIPDELFLALEKPFGTDEASARELNRLLHDVVGEERIFRVDHFLGEAMVLNMLGLRFANRVFEPVWNAGNVELLEVVADETLALEGRAGYYDSSGALVDMIQNHLLSVLALSAMEEPSRVAPGELHDAMLDLLRAVEVVGSRRGRYTQGEVDGKRVPSYVDEEGVDPARGTETFTQVELRIANERWDGARVVLRSGKALGTYRRDVVLHLRPVDHPRGDLLGEATPNLVRLSLKPAGVTIDIATNGRGDKLRLETTHLEADLGDSPVAPYGEVLRCVLDRNHLLSVRGDVVEECWRIVDPVRAAWDAGDVPLEDYAAGSDGP